MTLSPSSDPTLHASQPMASTPTLKAILFQIANLNLAVRIESVFKILKQPPIDSSGINCAAIAHLHDQEVRVFDLHRQIFHTSSISKLPYLIVVQSTTTDRCAIPVQTVPSLIQIPLSTLRVLPESYRHADTLGVASHVALIPHIPTPLTVFLLDVTQL